MINKKQKLVFQSKIVFAEGNIPKEIQILPVGKWDHPAYGVISITAEDITQFKQNFDAKIRKDIPITQGHESFDEKPAVGWFTEVEDRGEQGLWGQVEWNESGKTALKQKAFKYFSPEFYQFYEDPETREEYKNVLVGGALTNKPYFKGLKAVVFSDSNLIKLNDNNDMELKDLLKKPVAELTDEEKVFINEHKDELSEEDKTALGDVLVADPAPTPDPAPDPAPDPTPDPAKASEPKQKVQVDAAELAALKDAANKGAQAFAELTNMKIQSQLKSLMFSETNKSGRFLPKSEAKVSAFMVSLSEKQRASFCEIMGEVPAANLFSEKGQNAATENSAAAEVETKIKALMSENKGMSYTDALRKVFAENSDLAARYERERAE